MWVMPARVRPVRDELDRVSVTSSKIEGGGFTVGVGTLSPEHDFEGSGHERVKPQGGAMSALLTRIRRFTRSPQGRRAVAAVRQAARDPRNRAQAGRLLDRLRRRR